VLSDSSYLIYGIFMTLKNVLYLSVFLISANVNASEKPEFDIDGLKIGDKLTEEFSGKYCPIKNNGSKEIECKRKYDINGIPVSVLYLFYGDSLVTVSLSFESKVYSKLVRAYQNKYLDSPYEQFKEPILLGNGEEFTNEKALWSTTAGDFVVEKYGHNFTEGYAHLDSHKYSKYINKKVNQRNGGNLISFFSEIFD
ncbi:MAG: hypothetical protein ACI9N9_001307, partial [Enterobacterales bacterium]